jgi:hypothetical protein
MSDDAPSFHTLLQDIRYRCDQEVLEGIRSAQRRNSDEFGPARIPAYLAALRRLELKYAELPDKSPAARRAFCLEYLDWVGGVLSAMGLEAFHLHHELENALRTAEVNERHPLFRLDRDPVSVFRENFLDADVEASAALILARVVDVELGSQKEWAERIAKALSRAGYRPHGRSAYTASAVIKWRNACVRGEHPSADHDLLATATLTPAEKRLADLVRHCRLLYGR